MLVRPVVDIPVRIAELTLDAEEFGEGFAGTSDEGAEGEEVEAETYMWIGGEDSLEKREWDFAEFQKEKMRFWVGDGVDEEYAGEYRLQ